MSWTADEWNEFLARCEEIRALLAQVTAELEESIERGKATNEGLAAMVERFEALT